jgi:hypothetical protein
VIDDREIIRKMQVGYKAKIKKSRLRKKYPWGIQLSFKGRYSAGIYEAFETWFEATETLKLWHEGKIRE